MKKHERALLRRLRGLPPEPDLTEFNERLEARRLLSQRSGLAPVSAAAACNRGHDLTLPGSLYHLSVGRSICRLCQLARTRAARAAKAR